MRVEGFLYEPLSSRRTAATLRRIGDTHHIIAEGDRKWRQVGIRSAAPPLAGIPETITLTTGETFAPHAPLPEGFLDGGRVGIWRRLTRLEGFSVPKAACLILFLILALFALRAALPWVADGAAPLVSRNIEAENGKEHPSGAGQIRVPGEPASFGTPTAHRGEGGDTYRGRRLRGRPRNRVPGRGDPRRERICRPGRTGCAHRPPGWNHALRRGGCGGDRA